jgi:hypothetical protein
MMTLVRDSKERRHERIAERREKRMKAKREGQGGSLPKHKMSLKY